ncbi:MAG TPA: hypothetical protein PKC24_01115 [Cyclobacteriaceae bacterium]|nr:hypothetical protein [Cyclobacteriaceae bacterium]
MLRKYFPLDKNYLLEKAQLSLEPSLIPQIIEIAKKHYQLKYNPLGLEDSSTLRIKKYKLQKTERFLLFYRDLAGIYRFKYGDNQLEFLFDGTDHIQKYKEDWTKTFLDWIEQFCLKEQFLRVVLDLSVYYNEVDKPQLVENRLQSFIPAFFDLKISKHKGILQKSA